MPNKHTPVENREIDLSAIMSAIKLSERQNDSALSKLENRPSGIHHSSALMDKEKLSAIEHSERTVRQSDRTFKKLEQSLDELPKQIRVFSESMKKRYVDQAIANEESCIKYQELRNNTKNDALIYVKAILPVIEVVISEIEDVVDHFTNLSFNQLKTQITGMLEELKNCRQLCEMTKSMNEDSMVVLKQREDKATEVVREIRDLQEECKKKQAEFQTSAELKIKLAFGFGFVPGINLIVAPALFIASSNDKKEALELGAQAQAKGAVATVVSETLIIALNAFIEGLGTMARFFAELENAIMNYHKKGEILMKDEQSAVGPLVDLMNRNASNIVDKCRMFRMVLPAVKTDFEAICGPDPDGYEDQEIDHEYVFKRLKKMMALTSNLRKTPEKITDTLRVLMDHQRRLANPGANETRDLMSEQFRDRNCRSGVKPTNDWNSIV